MIRLPRNACIVLSTMATKSCANAGMAAITTPAASAIAFIIVSFRCILPLT